MRCYHFGNMYLSSIQQGIQAAHAQMELFVKYNPGKQLTPYAKDKAIIHSNATADLYQWAEEDRTMICLNAGYNSEMLKIIEFLDSDENPYPWSFFTESKEALNGLITNIAIVLPIRIYGVSDYSLNAADGYTIARHQLTKFECELIRMKNRFRMAS